MLDDSNTEDPRRQFGIFYKVVNVEGKALFLATLSIAVVLSPHIKHKFIAWSFNYT